MYEGHLALPQMLRRCMLSGVEEPCHQRQHGVRGAGHTTVLGIEDGWAAARTRLVSKSSILPAYASRTYCSVVFALGAHILSRAQTEERIGLERYLPAVCVRRA